MSRSDRRGAGASPRVPSEQLHPDRATSRRENQGSVTAASPDSLQALIETAVARQNDVLIITEFEGTTDRIVYANEAIARHAGYAPEEVIGNTPRMFQGPDTSRETLERIRSAVDGWFPIRAELLNYRKDGTTYWNEIEITPIFGSDGVATHMVSVQRDITDRKESVDEMQRKDTRFLLALEASANAVWDWNVFTDRLEFRDNLAGSTWRGRQHGKIRGTGLDTLINLVHPDDRSRLRQTLMSKLAGNEHLHVKEYRLRRHDGTYADVSDRQFILRDANGKVERLVGSILDISDKRELKARRQQSQRLELLGEMTGGIAHNFNNLLTAILGGVDRLRTESADAATMQETVNSIDEAAQRGAALTAHLTAFSQVRTLALKPVDVRHLIAAIAPVWRNLVPNNIRFSIDLPSDLWPVRSDSAHLEAAILNIVLNSRDAMPHGGEITITGENLEAGSQMIRTRDGQEPTRHVMITISDIGIGMPPEDVKKAFAPFFTTKPVGKGTGLVLSSAYGFMQQSGGFMRLKSTPKEGTTVSVFLQTADEDPALKTLNAPRHLITDGGCRILVVDDDALVSEFVRSLLTSLSYKVTTAANGPEALQVLASDAPLDLLFTDILMAGGMNGWELARRARELRPDLPVLFTSAHPDAVDPLSKDRVAMAPLLRKPYRARELSLSILAAIAEGAAPKDT